LRRITKAALGGLAGCALILGGIQAASGDVIKNLIGPEFPLVDLDNGQPTSTTALDDAKATLRIIPAPDGAATSFKLQVTDIADSVEAGTVFGAHLHVGKCVEPTAELTNPTGPHYKADDQPASPDNEVWFNLLVNDQNNATDDTKVLFRPTDVDGDMSIVIHVDVAAVSSPKQACLPLRVESLNPPVESSVSP
jgi:hypothetical protein